LCSDYNKWNKLWETEPDIHYLFVAQAEHYELITEMTYNEWKRQVKAEGDKLQERIEIMEQAKKIVHDNIIEPQRQKLEAIQKIIYDYKEECQNDPYAYINLGKLLEVLDS